MGNDWHWNIGTPFYQRLGVTEKTLAASAGLRRPTLNVLRFDRDSVASVLVRVYLAARDRDPTLTLHDILAITDAPHPLIVPRAVPDDALTAPTLPGFVGVHIGSTSIRRRLGLSSGVVAKGAGIGGNSLSRFEYGHLHPKISTLVAIYRTLHAHDPTLTLHDLLIITPHAQFRTESDPPTPDTESDSHPERPPPTQTDPDTDTLLVLWHRLSPHGKQETLRFLRNILGHQ